MRICLPAGAKSKLDWSKERKLAESSSKPIVWEFDFGLFEGLLNSVDDRAQIETLGLAIDHFQSTLFPDFKSDSVVIYKGGLDWSKTILQYPRQLDLFRSWCVQHALDEENSQARRLYARDATMGLLQGLLMRFDADLKIVLEITPEDYLRPHEILQLTAREKWEHFVLNLADKELSDDQSELGLLLPSGSTYDSSKWLYIDSVIEQLRSSSTPLRLISETYLTNQWHGLERLLIEKNGVSVQGNRKLLGFIAAGGEVIDCKEFFGSHK